MQHIRATELTGSDGIRDYLAMQEKKSLLRFLTCGSVDDGKSTLIGRLLYDTKLIFDDQLATLERDSRKHGTNGDDIDFALLVDGLEAEREQGITIDVAYRFFATPKRKFIVADTPGHEQYTRNMATGASTADVAVVLIDARQGVLVQTRRHSIIASLLGIRHVVLAINKFDLVGFDQTVFDEIAAAYAAFASSLGFASITPIPMSARFGDNVTRRSDRMRWYSGPTLLEHLESIVVDTIPQSAPFRFPVQYVNRPNLDFRGFAGTIASGSIGQGDEVVVAKSGKASRVKRIVTHGGDLARAVEGQAVTLVLEDEVEVSRGNMLVSPGARPHVADQFAANIVWFDENALVPGRSYLIRTETDQASATVTDLKYRIDVNSFAHEAASELAMNAVGVCEISTQSPIAFDAFAENRATGSFILIDRITNATVGAGMFLYPLRRAANIHWQTLEIDKQTRAAQKGQTAGRAVVHRAFGLGQVDHRQPAREEAARRRQAHLHPRRRQCPPWAEPRSRLHRGRPRREHQACRRGGAADGRRRPRRAGLVHLAVPRRAPLRARDHGAGRVRRGVRRHAVRGMRQARSQGPLRQGAEWRDQELHRARFAL